MEIMEIDEASHQEFKRHEDRGTYIVSTKLTGEEWGTAVLGSRRQRSRAKSLASHAAGCSIQTKTPPSATLCLLGLVGW